jgi:hypothetical protein
MSDLYEIDTAAWSEQQTALLRRVAAGEQPDVAPKRAIDDIAYSEAQVLGDWFP